MMITFTFIERENRSLEAQKKSIVHVDRRLETSHLTPENVHSELGLTGHVEVWSNILGKRM